jgi:hypothetical protein
MYAIEFKADISNGVIEIPQQYRDKMQSHVNVKLLSEEKTKINFFLNYTRNVGNNI